MEYSFFKLSTLKNDIFTIYITINQSYYFLKIYYNMLHNNIKPIIIFILAIFKIIFVNIMQIDDNYNIKTNITNNNIVY